MSKAVLWRALVVLSAAFGAVLVIDAIHGPALRAQATVASGSQLAAPAATPQALVTRYCAGCHNERLKRGDLVLEGLDPLHPGAHVAVWEKVVKKLQGGVMPPPGAP